MREIFNFSLQSSHFLGKALALEFTLDSLHIQHPMFPFPFCSQSQFRFDNECYLNLPDNHKRVSDEPELTSMVDQSMQTVSIFIFILSRLHLICTLFNHSVTAFEYIRGN